ncbi:MAG TPA: CBS domain-containing protein [Candidatus Micrarchaeota archaeon]|nr:CBS domain-containing protein [Candidatus Micrarchaeota archaeon]
MKDDIKVGDVMTVGVITLPQEKSADDAAKLLRKTKVGCIIVTKKGKADGIVTERDLIYKVVAEGRNPSKTTLHEIMSTPLRVIDAGADLNTVAKAMKSNKVKRLPVIDRKQRLVGIVSEGDLVRVYPGVTDVLVEQAKLRFSKNEIFTGVCDSCGLFSENLKRFEGRLVCDVCREEEEI